MIYKIFVLFSLFLTSCSISNGSIYKKEYSRLVIYHDKPAGALHRNTFVFGGWKIHYKNEEGKTGECSVTKTVYNIMNVGDYFDCDIQGVDMVEWWKSTQEENIQW